MRPESTSIALRRDDLTPAAQEFDAEAAQRGFIGRIVAPVFEVEEASSKFAIMNRADFKKPADTSRAEGGAFNRITGTFGEGVYSCEEHGLEYPIDDRRRKRYASWIDAENAAVRILRHQILLAHEMRVAALIAAAGFTNTGAATAWSTSATAVPISDIITGCEALEDKTGIPRSQYSLIIPRDAYREMLTTVQVNSKIQYTYPGIQPGLLRADQTAGILGIREVLLAMSVYDSTEEGIAETNTQIWTAGICYLVILARAREPIDVPSVARTMLWTRSAPELPVIESYRDEAVMSDIVRMRDDTDEVLMGETDLFAYKLTA